MQILELWGDKIGKRENRILLLRKIFTQKHLLPLDVKTIIKCIYFFVNMNVFFGKEWQYPFFSIYALIGINEQ